MIIGNCASNFQIKNLLNLQFTATTAAILILKSHFDNTQVI